MTEDLTIKDMILLESEIAIKWSDNSESYVPLKALRIHCPCANCSGEKDVFGNVYKGPDKELTELAYKAINVKRIGHYAVRLFWKDGHSDGLYTYEMLQTLSR